MFLSFLILLFFSHMYIHNLQKMGNNVRWIVKYYYNTGGKELFPFLITTSATSKPLKSKSSIKKKKARSYSNANSWYWHVTVLLFHTNLIYHFSLPLSLILPCRNHDLLPQLDSWVSLLPLHLSLPTVARVTILNVNMIIWCHCPNTLMASFHGLK